MPPERFTMKSYYSEHLNKPKRSLVGQIQWANNHVRNYAKTNGHPKEVCVPSDKCFKHHPYCIAKFEKWDFDRAANTYYDESRC